VLVHELTHAVMRERLGRDAYERLPVWLREGLAIHAAREGLRHLRRTLLACEDVEALLTGLMGRTRRLAMYPYAWLAVDALCARSGADSPARLVALLEQGLAPRAAVLRVHGGSWPSFEQHARRHARERIEAEAQGLPSIRAARALYAARRHDEARAGFTAFLERFPESAFAPTARYLLGRCWFREGAWAAAEDAFTLCLEHDRGASGWNDECRLFRGIARHELGRDADALEDLRAYVDLHACADQRDLAHLALGRVLSRLGRQGEARAAFETVAALPGARAAHRHAAARELAALEG
jgi:tetratricopeptide (TPR) repeat protein